MARKKYKFQSTTLFQETLEQMQSLGYKDSTLKSFRIKFMEIDYFMLEHSYVKYDSEVKNAYVQYIMNGCDYNNLKRYKQAILMLYHKNCLRGSQILTCLNNPHHLADNSINNDNVKLFSRNSRGTGVL